MWTILFYYSIVFISAFWAYKAEYSLNIKKELYFRILLFFTLWIPAAIRIDIGTDYISYVSIFNYVQYGEIEPGFYYICSLLRKIGAESQWLFASISFLTYFPVCFGIPKKGLCVSILIFCCLFYLNTYSLIRQGLAVCLIWYASYALLYEKRAKFFIFTLLATTFHYSALIILPFYFIRNNVSLSRTMIVLILFVGVISIEYFNLIDKIFSSSLFLDSHYGVYATSEFNRETELGTGLGVIIRLLIPIYSLFTLPKMRILLRDMDM